MGMIRFPGLLGPAPFNCHSPACSLWPAAMTGTILSILMLASAILVAGGIFAIAKKKDRKRGILMILCGLVTFANVIIATVPIG